jgi:hypothetical protein
MTYRVTLQNNSNIDVSTKKTTTRQIDVDTSIVIPPGSSTLEGLDDVNIQNRSNNSVLMYNASTGKYDHVHPYEVLDRSDGVDDGSLDYGTY